MDQQALMGVPAMRSCERFFTVVGLLKEAAIKFEAVDDIPSGGSDVRFDPAAGRWVVTACS